MKKRLWREEKSFRYRRNVSLRFIATASAFTAVGSVLGLLRMLNMAGFVPFNDFKQFSFHPFLQIYGFLVMIAIGVSYALLPLLNSSDLTGRFSVELSYLAGFGGIALLTSPITGIMIPDARPAGELFLLLGVLAYSYEISHILGGRGSRWRYANRIFLLFPFSIVASIMLLLLHLYYTGIADNLPFLYLSLAEGTGSMVFAVAIRTTGFRLTEQRRESVGVMYNLLAVSIALTIAADVVPWRPLLMIGAALYLGTAMIFAYSTRSFERAYFLRKIAPVQERTESPHAVLKYVRYSYTISTIWLMVAAIAGFADATISGAIFPLTIIFIHSIAVGFMGTMIIGYAPLIFPVMLGRRGPDESVSYIPVILLTAGVILFDISEIMSIRIGVTPVWFPISGILIILSMAYFFINVHRSLF